MTWPNVPPMPPIEMPPARTLNVPGHGELFLRDTGGDGPPVMLLHGWMASADLNWQAAYRDLYNAGYRVVAIDHRGHGRGLRQIGPFRLKDCAADAAAALRQLGIAPAIVVGYSMGGAIAQLVAHEHPDVVSGLVLSGTAQHWKEPELQRTWKAMAGLGLAVALRPHATFRAGFRRMKLPQTPQTAWLLAELTRHSARDIAEAGRELGRFDSRPWLKNVRAPSAVVLTSRDEAVSPRKQQQLAQALGAQVFEAPVRHVQVVSHAHLYNPALLKALAAVSNGAPAGSNGAAPAREDRAAVR